jgi:hypothetical protein
MANDFQPALPRAIEWTVGENRYDRDGKNPRQLSVFVPLEAAHAMAQHLMNLADDTSKHSSRQVWDHASKGKIEVQGFYLNGNGRDGAYGSFGTINPKALAPAALDF